jgi:DNA invertase Pin-like site-specific DNA recombinase
MTALQRIRKEYNEPAAEVIKGMAIQGHSRRAVALILEVPRTTLTRISQRLDVDRYFKRYVDLRSECKGGRYKNV